jgi:hypothetical protein
MPAASAPTVSKVPSPTTRRTKLNVDAPSALRIASSRRWFSIDVVITPYTPTSARNTAMPAKAVAAIAEERGRVSAVLTRSVSVPASLSDTLGSRR